MRSFETPSAATTVDAHEAFRYFAQRGTPDDPVNEPTGPVAPVLAAEPTDERLLPVDELPGVHTDAPPAADLVVSPDDLFSGEYPAQETVVGLPPTRPKRASLREATQTLAVVGTTFGDPPASGLLVAGAKLQGITLKAPPRAPARNEGTRVRMLPSGEPLSVETPADPWGDGTLPEVSAPSVQARQPSMEPPVPWRDLSPSSSPAAWIESPHTVRMTLPPPAPSLPASPVSSMRVLLIAVAMVVLLAFALGVLVGR